MIHPQLHVYSRLADRITVFKPENSRPELVKAWEKMIMQMMDDITETGKYLYDFRQLKGLSMHSLRASVRVRMHPNIHLTYVAILTKHSRVTELVSTIIAIQPGGTFHMTSDEADAIRWLNEQEDR